MRALGAPSVFFLTLSISSIASAQTLFSENWEAGTTNWRSADGGPIVVQKDSAPACSTNYQHETVLFSGGRVFTNGTGPSQIAVTGGKAYCLSGWVRGSTGTRPFLGIVLDNGTGSAKGTPHWLIGGDGTYDNGYGAPATPVVSDGAWHWYTAAFTIELTATFVVLTDELFSGGTTGSADFDDITFNAGICPPQPITDPHLACTPLNAFCSASGACGACTTANDCAPFPSTPTCVAGVCVAAPAPDFGTPPPDLAMRPADLAMRPADLALPPADLAQAPADLAATPADLAAAPADMATTPADLAKAGDLAMTAPADMSAQAGNDLAGATPNDLAQAATGSDLAAGTGTDLATPPNGTPTLQGGGLQCAFGTSGELGGGALFFMIAALLLRRRRRA